MYKRHVVLQSRHLLTGELRDREISVACAKVMSQFHKLTMPFVKQPTWLFDTMTRSDAELYSYYTHSVCM